jgi:hypothetical protein
MSDSADICVICQDNLCTGAVFEIPECKHSFHQICINTWFRQGNGKCPLCNSCGVGDECCLGMQDWHARRFVQLRRASRRKDAPKQLIKSITRIKKREQDIKNLRKELKCWKEKEVILDGEKISVKEAISKYKKLFRKCRTKTWQLRRAKIALAQQQQMIPIILVERRVID